MEKNKDVIRRYIDAWNRGDLQALIGFWSPDLVHNTRNGSHGYEQTKRIVARFLDFFPEMQFQIEDMIGEGDRIVTRMTWSAPNKSGFMGLPPTGKQITCTVIGVARLSHGKIVEHWGVTDELALMAELGMVPKELLYVMDQG